MSSIDGLGDCPVCLSSRSVRGGRCELCAAEFSDGAADLPPAVPSASDVRMRDVIEELRAIASAGMASSAGGDVADACRRAEELLVRLRRHFLQDVVVGRPR